MSSKKKQPVSKRGAPATTSGRGITTPSAFDDLDRFFNTFFPRSWLQPLQTDWPKTMEWPGAEGKRVPSVDVEDKDNAIVVHAELPGVEKKDLDISLTETHLTIKAKTQKEEKKEDGNFYRSEIRRGEFSRTIPLPVAVNGEAAKAKFDNGVLELTLPKMEKSQRRSVRID